METYALEVNFRALFIINYIKFSQESEQECHASGASASACSSNGTCADMKVGCVWDGHSDDVAYSCLTGNDYCKKYGGRSPMVCKKIDICRWDKDLTTCQQDPNKNGELRKLSAGNS
jgi:hypothetical protein